MDEIIKKINRFSQLARERELTEEEKKEREEVRKIYLENFKKSIKIVRVDDEGNPINDDGEIIEPEA